MEDLDLQLEDWELEGFGEDDEDLLDEDDDEDLLDEDDDEAEHAERRRRFGFNRKFKRGVPRMRGSVQTSRGVRSATLRTPQGNARLQLPRSVVTLAAFNKAVASLKKSHNALAAQVSANRTAITKSAVEARKLASATNLALKKQEKAQRQGQMMSMLIAMMASQQTNQRLDAISGSTSSSNNSMMMMLPMMMMGGDSGGDNNMMMMMMVIMMMGMNQQHSATP